jgi:hypothetical protein
MSQMLHTPYTLPRTYCMVRLAYALFLIYLLQYAITSTYVRMYVDESGFI